MRSHPAILRTPPSARAARRLLLRRTAVEYLRPDFLHRVTQAHAQQRLARVLEGVNDLTLRVLQVNALSIGQEVIFRAVAYGFSQPMSEFLLQEFHNAADTLQREALVPQSANDRDLRDVIKGVQPAPAFAPRLHDAALVPPLKLARRYARERYHLRRCKTLVHLV